MRALNSEWSKGSQPVQASCGANEHVDSSNLQVDMSANCEHNKCLGQIR